MHMAEGATGMCWQQAKTGTCISKRQADKQHAEGQCSIEDMEEIGRKRQANATAAWHR
jgi:hypothetical protein